MTPRSRRSRQPFHPPEQGEQQGGTDQAFLDLESPLLTCDVPLFQVEPPTGGSPWNAPPPGTAEPAERLAEIRERKAERKRVREEFTERRRYGLVRRYRNKLRHLKERREGSG